MRRALALLAAILLAGCASPRTPKAGDPDVFRPTAPISYPEPR